MAAPHSLDDTFRCHDEAIQQWLAGLLVDYGVIAGTPRNQFPLLSIFASPQRAFAQVVDLLVHKGWIAGADAESMRARANQPDMAVLPLPVATITRGDPVPDNKHSGVPKVKYGYLDDLGKRTQYAYPNVYIVPYEIDFWCLKAYTRSYILEWLYSQFGVLGASPNECFLKITHPLPFGKQFHALTLDNQRDLSEIEGAGQRYFRFRATVQLRMLHFRNNGAGPTPLIKRLEVYGPSDNVANDNIIAKPININLLSAYNCANALGADGVLVAGGVGTLDVDFVVAGSVQVVRVPLEIDLNGMRLVSVSFDYVSSGAVTLEVAESTDRENWFSATTRALPPTSAWKRVHLFFAIERLWVETGFTGTLGATLGVRNLALFDSEQTGAVVATGGPQVFSVPITGDSLVVARVAPGAAGTMTVDDDATTPSYSVTQPVDPNEQHAAVQLISPKNGTLKVTLSPGLVASTVFAVPYDGPYEGNEL